MKFKEISTPLFTPVEISIKIETKRELELWWAISNQSYDTLEQFANKGLEGTPEIQKFTSTEKAIKAFEPLFAIMERNLRIIKDN